MFFVQVTSHDASTRSRSKSAASPSSLSSFPYSCTWITLYCSLLRYAGWTETLWQQALKKKSPNKRCKKRRWVRDKDGEKRLGTRRRNRGAGEKEAEIRGGGPGEKKSSVGAKNKDRGREKERYRERERGVFLPNGSFCAGFARSSPRRSGTTRRAALRRRRNRSRALPAKRGLEHKRVSRESWRHSWWGCAVGASSASGRERPSLGHEKGYVGGMEVEGQFSLNCAEGKGVSCVVPAGRRGLGKRDRGSAVGMRRAES